MGLKADRDGLVTPHATAPIPNTYVIHAAVALATKGIYKLF